MFMLAPHRWRCSLHSRPKTSTRTLRTLPRPLPAYTAALWNPAKRQPAWRPRPGPETPESRIEDQKRLCKRLERRNLRDRLVSQRSAIEHGHGVPLGGSLVTAHFLDQLSQFWNTSLLDLSRHTPQRVALWHSFTMAVELDPEIIHRLTDRSWDILRFTVPPVGNPSPAAQRFSKMVHTYLHDAGRTGTVGARITEFEILCFRGLHEEALQAWEDDQLCSNNAERHDYKPEHLEAGARLHSLVGSAIRAQEIWEELFELYPTWKTSTTRGLIFRAQTYVQSRSHLEQTRAIYTDIPNPEMIPSEAYDNYLVGFVETRDLEFARRTFRDMLQAGHLRPRGTQEDITRVLDRLHMLYNLDRDIQDSTKIALDMLSLLPSAYHNFLFSAWIKAAARNKAPWVAAQILDEMKHRSFKPEVFHMNLLLRTWLRSPQQQLQLKAENIAWEMISKAKKLTKSVWMTWEESIFQANEADSGQEEQPFELPPGNGVTFSLMIARHEESLQWEHVDYLLRRFKGLDFEPDTWVMNAVMNSSCRKGAYSEVWALYSKLTGARNGVFPDGATFRCLWRTLRNAFSDHGKQTNKDLPTPRELTAEMVEWTKLINRRSDKGRFTLGLAAEELGAITPLILHCFSYTKDLAGSLVALHVLRHQLNIFPTDEAVDIIQRQLAWIDLSRPAAEASASHLFDDMFNAKNAERLERAYEIVRKRRVERMNYSEEEVASLSEEAHGDLGLNLISEYIRVVLKRAYPPKMVEEMIHAARLEIGMPDLPTGDMNAFQVA